MYKFESSGYPWSSGEEKDEQVPEDARVFWLSRSIRREHVVTVLQKAKEWGIPPVCRRES